MDKIKVKTAHMPFKVLLMMSCIYLSLSFQLPCSYDTAYAGYAYCDRNTNTVITKLPLLSVQPLFCDPVTTMVSSCPFGMPKCQYDAGTKMQCNEERRNRVILKRLLNGSDGSCKQTFKTIEPCGKYYLPNLGGWHKCVYGFGMVIHCKTAPDIKVAVRKLEFGPLEYCPMFFTDIDDCEPAEQDVVHSPTTIIRSKCGYVANKWLGCLNHKNEFRLTTIFLINGDIDCPRIKKVKTICTSSVHNTTHHIF